MPGKIRLYSYRRCPFAIRVRMTLHEKGIPFETIEEELKNFSPELRRLHPEAKVPLLVNGDFVVYESAVITEYINDLTPEYPLMPEDAAGRAKVRLWTYWCNQLFKPEIDRFKYGAVKLSVSEVEDAKEKLKSQMQKIEDELAQTEWLAGHQFTLADIHVFPFYRQLSKVTPPHPEFENYPKAKAWFEKIAGRPSFEKAMIKT